MMSNREMCEKSMLIALTELGIETTPKEVKRIHDLARLHSLAKGYDPDASDFGWLSSIAEYLKEYVK